MNMRIDNPTASESQQHWKTTCFEAKSAQVLINQDLAFGQLHDEPQSVHVSGGELATSAVPCDILVVGVRFLQHR